MRIGIDIRDAGPGRVGVQRYLWNLGAWLGAAGHDVRMLTVRRQPAGIETPPGVTLERLDGLSRAALRAHVRALVLDVLLINPERARRYRGLHANVLRAAYGTDHYSQALRSVHLPLERAARRLLRVTPWVLAERRWERAFYESEPMPEVIAQSHYAKREILRTYRVSDDRVHVIPNGVDTSAFSPEERLARRDAVRARFGVRDGEFCVLFIGHNFRRKGLWLALPALATVASAHLIVAGRGTGIAQRREAARRIRALGLGSRVTIAGSMPAIEAYAAADALLHLTWHDTFGFVVLEAMACGLPVVTTPYAGASELIESGRTGFIVDPASEHALRATLATLADEGVRERLGRAARGAAELHREEVNFAAVLRVFSLAASRGTGPVR